MTVLYTTHYMEEAQELSDRVGIIDHGELIALGTQAELTRQVGADGNARPALRRRRGRRRRWRDALRRRWTACCDADYDRPRRHASWPPRPKRSWRRQSAAPMTDGIKIRSVDIHEPNLEAVFLHLTGRALRD